MTIATELYARNLVFPIKLDESPCANELNIANVCVGYAFELAYKALVEVSEQQPDPTHLLSDAHAKLDDQLRIEVERAIVSHGWKNVDSFLSHFDEEIRHADRKYWMRPKPPATGNAQSHFWFGYPTGIDFLAKLHKDLLDLVESRIDSGAP